MDDRLPPIPEQHEIDAFEEQERRETALDAFLDALTRLSFWAVAIFAAWLVLRISVGGA